MSQIKIVYNCRFCDFNKDGQCERKGGRKTEYTEGIPGWCPLERK